MINKQTISQKRTHKLTSFPLWSRLTLMAFFSSRAGNLLLTVRNLLLFKCNNWRKITVIFTWVNTGNPNGSLARKQSSHSKWVISSRQKINNNTWQQHGQWKNGKTISIICKQLGYLLACYYPNAPLLVGCKSSVRSQTQINSHVQQWPDRSRRYSNSLSGCDIYSASLWPNVMSVHGILSWSRSLCLSLRKWVQGSTRTHFNGTNIP